jgi:hypothetical protein
MQQRIRFFYGLAHARVLLRESQNFLRKKVKKKWININRQIILTQLNNILFQATFK